MNLDEFIKKYKINKLYSYSEVPSGKFTEYGWEAVDSIDMSSGVIISYQSQSKKISQEDLDWSKEEGKNAASLNCYLNYFEAATKMSPKDFIEKWSGKEDELSSLNSTVNNRGDEGSFMIDLAKLIEGGGKMVRYGRIFKLINF
tara:strand:- start:2461 stop:2892 length:432 start_codon:yes stop_codon:yes gene_type:complete